MNNTSCDSLFFGSTITKELSRDIVGLIEIICDDTINHYIPANKVLLNIIIHHINVVS